MTKLVRLMLVWLMLLAIPFQGIASAAMLSCVHDAPGAPSHTAGAVPASASAGHCHDAAPQATPAMHHADAASHDGHDHDSRCSACAVCCMGAAIAPLPAVAGAPAAAALLHVATANHRLPAVDLALPERPPRPSLA